MSFDSPYLILAYYNFVSVAEPLEEVKNHKAFLCQKEVKSRIYISEQGINGQLSAAAGDAHAYMEWMKSHPLFSSTQFKIAPYHEHTFPRQTIKYREQLVALDTPLEIEEGGEYLSPDEWKRWLEEDKKKVVLDVRNDYEWRVGHFSGAEEPPCKTFRDFNAYAEQLKEKVDPATTPIMMYCTGGIRCEIYSVLMKKQGFKKVYQLEGGVISYGEQIGADHWKGKLFVFDDRMTVPLKEGEETAVVGKCHLCSSPIEDYYNCANMDCNELFLCCQECVANHKGCCSISCSSAPRIRPINQLNPHKPFKKWYYYPSVTK